MKLIFGLGNPGRKYEKTRHNVGWLFLDFLAQKFSFNESKTEKKLKAEVAEGSINGEKTLLIKPLTYMNLSGEAVQMVMNFYKLSKEDVMVIYDDKDMEFGKVRFRETGSSGGHNGIKSIISVLGQDFNRIKIGVANEDLEKFEETSDFVLSKFKKKELEELGVVFEEAAEILSEKLSK